ncbi:MAG TPA: MmcQ/YjbR family DNA-binding protein [Bacteroidales bacterium]
MNVEEFRQYCLSKKGVTEELPFGPDTLVYKVMGKMFALTSLDGDFYINLKCDPDLAIELREKYPAVLPGYHMSKKHWNTVVVDGSISNKLIYEWTDHSYQLVADQLPKHLKNKLN